MDEIKLKLVIFTQSCKKYEYILHIGWETLCTNFKRNMFFGEIAKLVFSISVKKYHNGKVNIFKRENSTKTKTFELKN